MDEGNIVMRRQIVILLFLSIIFSSYALAQSKQKTKTTNPAPAAKDTSATVTKPLVTFIELGSVNCIPCKAMQPVMKAIEEKFGGQVKIIFYDVWKQAHYAQQYNIRLIPTQVFLDANGKELMRHEGFFPEKEIDSFLQSKGLKAKTGERG
jgi:thioredoxin 1